MSEKILEILIQLFAIIARPDSNADERKRVVAAFLQRMLNRELVQKYLSTYDAAYEEARKKLERSSYEKREGAIAIRIQKLCREINEQGQLAQNQRIVVIVQALEFCKSGGEASRHELGFINALAEGLNITAEEYGFIEKFVLNTFPNIPAIPNFLVINGIADYSAGVAKHVYKEQLKGDIWALFVPSAQMYFVRFKGCGELSMNGQLLQEEKVYPLSQGASIKGYKISPVYYWDITMQFLKDEFTASRVVYEANNIEYRFKSGAVGIHHMSFKEESGRMVGIMGASGAGKSTLLNVLNGTNSPNDGEVLINGINIHKEKDKTNGLIGYVSQDDLLIEELTVFQNLYYNAKLCFDNLSDAETVEKVDSVLTNLGLYEIRNIQVGSPLNKKISGGQRKRLNISLELIREPAIMFLDEPTSGLSSRDSENILDLLKELARKGKLLFVVIHQPSSEIFKMFDKLIILDTGGYLIYNGNPIDSIEYFKRKIAQANYNQSECYVCGNVNPEQIFNIVEARVRTESGQPTKTRRISPVDWCNLFAAENKVDVRQPGVAIPEINFKTPNRLRQFVVFTKRDVLSKISDIQYLLITLLEAPALAFFLAFLIKYFNASTKNPHYSLFENSNLPVYIFMSVIVAIFMGLTVSAEEIIKDRKILKREAFLNLSRNSYLMSKVFVQFGISAIQAFTFVLIGNGITEIKGMSFQYWLVLFSCWAGANMLGLIISDSFKAVVTIYILIPFLVIPQIILSGVMVKFEKLNPNISSPTSIPFYGEFITARWGYEALAVNQFIYNRFEHQFYQYEKMKSRGNFKRNFWSSEMKSRIESVSDNMKENERNGEFENDITVIRNEIAKEQAFTPEIKFEYLDSLVPDKITPEIVAAAQNYVEQIRRYYIDYYNFADGKRNALIETLEQEEGNRYFELRNKYHNKSLEEFAVNKNETTAIIEYKGELVQKMDPIFLDPQHPFLKAHFYAPAKQIFGIYIDTYMVNITVLWIITAGLYLILYFSLLKRALDAGEVLLGRKFKE
ncbi:MAG: ATP-binding cassette domain-containing protein [Bacteroidales bacterium]|jgi:ABC-type multidrug transport system ATPase subunit|nr:ATP-binding cassette domain-containing protein [Bacteroidales bacterium]